MAWTHCTQTTDTQESLVTWTRLPPHTEAPQILSHVITLTGPSVTYCSRKSQMCWKTSGLRKSLVCELCDMADR